MKNLAFIILLVMGLAVGTAGADGKISDLGALAAAPAVGDLVEIVDVSDTAMAATGTNKKITTANLFAGLAALEGAQTFTGAKTFGTDVKVLFRAAAQYVNSPAANVVEVAGGTTMRLKVDDEDLQLTKTGANDITIGSSTGVTNITTGINLTSTGTIAGKIPAVEGGSANISLSAAQVSGTIISNTGQGPNNRNHTLPTAAAGLSFIGAVGEAQAASYFRFTRGGSDTVCLDGTCAKTYVSIAAPSLGAQVACYTLQMASTGMNAVAGLAIGTTNTAVSSDAFTYDIANIGYSKAAVDAGTAPGADVVPQNKYGAVAFDIGIDGTIDAVSATANATGYDSAALAIAGIPAVAASHLRIGTVTAMKSDGTFTFGTTALSAANTTVAYTDTAVYTKPFVWQCGKSIGSWVTD